MDLVRGSGQTAVKGARFADPLEVGVNDAEGHPIRGSDGQLQRSRSRVFERDRDHDC